VPPIEVLLKRIEVLQEEIPKKQVYTDPQALGCFCRNLGFKQEMD
jgi:hypothetical protein